MRKIICLLGMSLMFACESENLEDLREPRDCDTFDVAYQKDIKAILTDNCTGAGCHNGPNGVGALDLSTYADTKTIADNGQLVGRIKGTTGNLMPPPGSNILTDCEIELISAWVSNGAPNN